MAKITVATDKKRSRALYMSSKYGIDLDEYETRFKGQRGACRICQGWEPGGNGQWHIDHCHSSGRVRGILCSPCNTALGMMRDRPDSLRRAADYVERHAADVPLGRPWEGMTAVCEAQSGMTFRVPITEEVAKYFPAGYFEGVRAAVDNHRGNL